MTTPDRWSSAGAHAREGSRPATTAVDDVCCAGWPFVRCDASEDDGSSRFEPGDWYPERRTGDVVQPDGVEEMDGFGVAAVLTADPELETWLGAPALLGGDLDQPPDAVTVD